MVRFMRRFSPATVMSAAALLVALSGTTSAATNGTFILGQPNSAGATSGLSSAVATGPTLTVANSGGKPAAKFSVSGGVAPLAVSNGTKVANLNADRLDGIDATELLRGSGSTYSVAAAMTPSSLPFDDTIVPGFLGVHAECLDGLLNVKFSNLSGATVNFFIATASASVPSPYHQASGAGGYFVSFGGDSAGDFKTFFIQGTPGGAQTVTTVQVGTVYRPNSGDCHLQIQALTTRQ